MAEFMVAIDHMTYDVVRAKDEVAAIGLVLEGEGEAMASETRDAPVTAYQTSDSPSFPCVRSWSSPAHSQGSLQRIAPPIERRSLEARQTATCPTMTVTDETRTGGA
jgi:hypothetical protein